jgi:hypothetical protein
MGSPSEAERGRSEEVQHLKPIIINQYHQETGELGTGKADPKEQ